MGYLYRIFQKTIHRLQTIQYAIPFAFDEFITINDHKCTNILYHSHQLRSAVLDTLMDIKTYHPIHGDCQLTNTMIDKNGKIYFIDARGYFGKSQVLGDARYDWAKVYYALSGNFDQFNVKNFDLEITSEVNFKIHSSGWEFLTDYFLKSIPISEANIKEIKLIHAIIWLSLASHAWEDFDSMCVAFYNGTLLFNEWREEYGENNTLVLSNLHHTWILDFDGTLVEHNGYKTGKDKWLPGALDFCVQFQKTITLSF